MPHAYDFRKRFTPKCKTHLGKPMLDEQCRRLLVHAVRRLASSLALLMLTGFLLFCLLVAKLLLLVYASELRSSKKTSGTSGDHSRSLVTWILTWAACAPCLLRLLARVVNLSQERGRSLSATQFLWALVCAAAQTMSLCLVLFCVLPSLDIFRGFFATFAFGAASSILRSLLNAERRGKLGERKLSPFAVGALLLLGQVAGWLVFRWSSDDLVTARRNERPVWELSAAILLAFFEGIADLLIASSSAIGSLPQPKQNTSSRSSYAALALITEPCKIGLFIAFAILLSSDGHAKTATNSAQGATTFLPHGKYYVWPPKAFEVREMSSEAKMRSIIAYAEGYQSAVFVLLPLAFALIGGISARLQPMALKLSTTLATPFSVALLSFWFLQRDDVTHAAAQKDVDSDMLSLDDLYMYILWILPLWLFQLWVLWKRKLESNAVLDSSASLLARYTAALPEIAVLDYASDLSMSSHSALAADLQPAEAEKETSSRGLSQPMVYVCVTVWHEQQHEMLRMLQSIVRLDEDQARRRHAQAMLSEIYRDDACRDPNYYSFEAHVFIDDAMEATDNDEWTINSYVRTFVKTVDLAVSEVFKHSVQLQAPSKCCTPYGGRLVWTLPGGNKLFVHLKDKNKVRNRKRWSQIMYMHYLAKYRRFEQCDSTDGDYTSQGDFMLGNDLNGEHTDQHYFKSASINVHSSSLAADDDIYLLAVDGDVDFRPDDVLRVVDCLRRDKRVGVACGRIHPIGAGPVVWYQQFEYAFSHWLQKSAEQVLGCVLCAPGAFSLFRASALMDNGVAEVYSSLATEPQHYVQYEQGEDRWLTALLMQNGYRVEYVANAAVLSHAPETLAEFFIQRRRWNPSTIAHTFDFLLNWRKTMRSNGDVTLAFVIYQAVVFTTWLLAPAGITAFLAGSLSTVFGLQMELSFLLAAAIPASYAVVCITASQGTQLKVAEVMNAASVLLMAALVIMLLINISEVSLFSCWGLFSLLEVTVFTTAAVFHPREFACLLHGVLYYLCIVTGYVLLVIYSVINLHLVSWGTREEQAPRSKSTDKKLRSGEDGDIPASSDAQELFNNNRTYLGQSKTPGYMQMTMWAEPSGPQSTDEQKVTAAALKSLHSSSCDVEAALNEHTNAANRTGLEKLERKESVNGNLGGASSDANDKAAEASRMTEPRLLCFSSESSCAISSAAAPWMKEPCLQQALNVPLSEKESHFWKSLVSGVLQPLPHDAKREAKMKADLRHLRNVVCCIVFVANIVWIIIVYHLQSAAALINQNVSQANDDDRARLIAAENNPVFSILLAVSATVLIAQYLCMLQHRWKNVVTCCDNGWPISYRLEPSEVQQYTVGHQNLALPLRWCEHVAVKALTDALNAVRAFHFCTDLAVDDKASYYSRTTTAIKRWRRKLCYANGKQKAVCNDEESGICNELPLRRDFRLRDRFEEAMCHIRRHLSSRDVDIANYKKDTQATSISQPLFCAPLRSHLREFRTDKAASDRSWSNTIGQLPGSEYFAHVTVER